MPTKEFGVKAYEKIEMVKRNPDLITVAVAEDLNSIFGYRFVLMVGEYPIASILSEIDLEAMSPDYEQSELLKNGFLAAARIDERQALEEFGANDSKVEDILDKTMSKMEFVENVVRQR